MTTENKTDYWPRQGGAYSSEAPTVELTLQDEPVGAEIPEPSLTLDRAGIIFDEVLVRIRAYENMLESAGARSVTLPASIPGDDFKRGEDYTFTINAQAILSMKYIAQGFYEELVSHGEFGRELAQDIVKSHGIAVVETHDWSSGITEEEEA